MPADLNKPFAESCCDGGECSTSKESAQPCGCDMGCKPLPHYCQYHLYQKGMIAQGIPQEEYIFEEEDGKTNNTP